MNVLKAIWEHRLLLQLAVQQGLFAKPFHAFYALECIRILSQILEGNQFQVILLGGAISHVTYQHNARKAPVHRIWFSIDYTDHKLG